MKKTMRLSFDWIYGLWKESDRREMDTLMAAAMVSAEMDALREVLGEL